MRRLLLLGGVLIALSSLPACGQRQEADKAATAGAAPATTAAARQVAALYPTLLAEIKAGNYDHARQLCQQAITLEPANPAHRYNMACLDALQGKKDDAVRRLGEAADRGFADYQSMQADADLASIQQHPGYDAVFTRVQENYDTQGAQAATPAAAAAPASQPAAAPPAGNVAVPVAGKMMGTKPVGLYYGQRYWIATGNLEKYTIYFAPDGHFYENPPGFSAADLAAVPASARGTYSVSGRNLTCTWANAPQKPYTWEMEINAGGFSYNGGLHMPVKAFQSARQLVGSYEGGSSMHLGSSTAITSKSLTLNADGTYSRGGIASMSSTTDGSTMHTGGVAPTQAGRWEWSGFQLTLTDNAGGVTRGVTFPLWESHLFFDGTTYKKQ